MSKIIFDSAISLDGYFAGENRGPENPMGGVSQQLHQWMFEQKAFWQNMGVERGEKDDRDGELIENVFSRTGAYIMGKRMFEEGEAVWPEDLYKADVYVLTHEKREPWVQNGSTVFYFINDGIASALEKAKKSANDQDVRIQGGADTIKQFLNAGLIDEFFIHIAPVFLGRGIRLFDEIRNDFDLKILEVIPSELTTHIRYGVSKK